MEADASQRPREQGALWEGVGAADVARKAKDRATGGLDTLPIGQPLAAPTSEHEKIEKIQKCKKQKSEDKPAGPDLKRQ